MWAFLRFIAAPVVPILWGLSRPLSAWLPGAGVMRDYAERPARGFPGAGALRARPTRLTSTV